MRRLLKLLLSFYPSRLPIGATEHDSWVTDIISLAGKGVPDNSSTRFAVAVMILHLGSTADRKPKRFFVRSLRKAASNEVAHSAAQGYKKKQDDEKAATTAVIDAQNI